ncbi:hypothetical protein RF11_16201 [Thelohanellus kitauei]|uniref:Uncharacterized protein n=1 Tax=Thelohanellus kitauei TaxID=669202 RepID=A0A0C2N4K9_THEKT|nr:hypothetical protein RF11_16201 [Thelohanellus kitauei]
MHPNFLNKDTNYSRLKAESRKSGLTFVALIKIQTVAVEASYLLELRITRAMKPRTIAEELLGTKEIDRVMIGEPFINKLSSLRIPNDTLYSKIVEMSAVILDQMIQV